MTDTIKRFREKFIKDKHGFECEGCCIHDFQEEIESFITEELKAQRKEIIDEVIEWTEKQKPPIRHKDILDIKKSLKKTVALKENWAVYKFVLDIQAHLKNKL